MHGICKCLATGDHNSILYNFGYKTFFEKSRSIGQNVMRFLRGGLIDSRIFCVISLVPFIGSF